MTDRAGNSAQVVRGTVGNWDSVRLIGPGGSLEATFIPGLGMVGSSLRHLGAELLGQRGGPEAYAERKSTFGIPLLHPWANRLRAWEYERGGHQVRLERESPVLKADPATGLPIHGALAACPHWELRGSGADENRAWVEASLDYAAHPELMATFPFAHRLTYRASVSDQALAISLEVTPTGAERVPIAFGFHPYLTLPGSDRESWEIQLPVERRAVLDDRGIPTGRDEPVAAVKASGPLGARTFDDSFPRLGSPQPVFSLSDGVRLVEVRFSESYPVAQVYAPSGSQFIALEPMTAPVDALSSGRGLPVVEPGETFSAEFSIRILRL